MESDVVIAGAGIIGLSVTRSLLLHEPRLKVLVVEKEEFLGAHALAETQEICTRDFSTARNP